MPKGIVAQQNIRWFIQNFLLNEDGIFFVCVTSQKVLVFAVSITVICSLYHKFAGSVHYFGHNHKSLYKSEKDTTFFDIGYYFVLTKKNEIRIGRKMQHHILVRFVIIIALMLAIIFHLVMTAVDKRE